MQRRHFVKGVAGTALAAPAFATKSSILGANDRIRVAVLGVNGRGQNHFEGLQPLENVEVTHFVDPDLEIARRRAGEFESKFGRKPTVVQDLRRALDDKDIDVVTIATPNHWHTLAAIWACQAGKDVYVEKPATHVFNEGLSLIAAAKKYNRIVQHGVQLRSSEAIREAVQKMRDGLIGEVYMARATIFKWRPQLQNFPDETPPETFDYDLWVGPGKYRPYSKRHVPYNWHWTWDYGNGEIGNQGIHETDMLQWGLGVGLPTKISAMGGNYLWRDHRETPEALGMQMEFDGGKKYAEVAVRFWCSNNETEAAGGNYLYRGLQSAYQRITGKSSDKANGNLFFGSEGFLEINEYESYAFFFGRNNEPGPSGSAPTRHYENFIQAVRSRKTEDQHGPVETAHSSAALAHLGNIAYRREQTLRFDPSVARFTNDDEANAMLGKPYRPGFEVPPPDRV
ncbi:MAG: gfo/Idh/MocA family oxidoreductase [Acidobacteria bacterium]|nr:gfo/Idh/MocA family oxidoreductase [Acidobacteriota bacterium]